MSEAARASFLPRPRAILFDWDNTLVDTWPCIGKATNITLEAMGLSPWSDAEIRARVAGSLRDTFPGIYGERWEQARDIYYKAFGDVHLEMLQSLPCAEDVLSASAGLYLGVVSNKTGRYLRAEAEHLGWGRYFRKVVGAQDAPRDKPDPAPVHLALSTGNIPAGPDVWFVGDAPIDVTCGRAAGCTTIIVGPAPLDGCVTERAHAYVKDCAALADLIRGHLA
ncbi:MAG: HAD family hydrolase [Rhodospirillaceae bacterium]